MSESVVRIPMEIGRTPAGLALSRPAGVFDRDAAVRMNVLLKGTQP